ncbi:LexA family transcriptional regulator [Pseudomonas sp. RIT-PI-S]|uniref:LexA family transcriptional regulator n=1 Tax=Pseudomonas sp. RIT-PI-S TaxID=3035295 RepID=UPI0021D9BB9A|nr:LexA family transcriptional regulator [Pseudomonas sp. RIT-PI-S]
MDTIALMHKSIDKVLAQLMTASDVSQADLARKTGVGQSTISRILKPSAPKGIKEPTDKQVRPLADFFGVSTDQLRGHQPLPGGGRTDFDRTSTSTLDLVSKMLSKHGKGLAPEAKARIAAVAKETAEARISDALSGDYLRAPEPGDEISIALYDIRAAMGGGQVPPDYPEVLHDVKVSQQHLRDLGVQYSDFNHLKIVHGWGSSMEPTIRHRDPLIVDVSIREFVGDGVYLLAWDDMLYVKRVQAVDPERLEMISDNPRHKDRVVLREDIYIMAKVLMVWNANLL